ncbi:hypothetical protein L1987_52337 [Smallanthus sonchifolius]|uniref:Uncharacterized protein n=1 Tax=Smallanthus sonchifolius TaxID=185202 RepID=A0ACB9EST3_9ASTR|nr:hypothetical protein L1987_52337 [Smallanthus sonchifolius]
MYYAFNLPFHKSKSTPLSLLKQTNTDFRVYATNLLHHQPSPPEFCLPPMLEFDFFRDEDEDGSISHTSSDADGAISSDKQTLDFRTLIHNLIYRLNSTRLTSSLTL